MSKHLIIDGYNLLGAAGQSVREGMQDGEAVRETLIQTLGRYQQRVGHPITIVFDAWRQVGGIQRDESRAGVTVIFSRQGEKADQVIQRMVRDYGSDCVIVSSDHEVLDTARAHRAMIIRSQEFWPKLQSSTSPARSRYQAKDDRDQGENVRVGKKGNPRKLPKALRTRLRNLKKF